MRYDAAIIGAGAEGLVAAALLAKARAKTIVIERAERAGGRLTTREFHPGFRVSPYADELPPVPADLHWTLDLTRRGAIFLPRRHSLALWPDGKNLFAFEGETPAARLLRHWRELAQAGYSSALLRARRSGFRLPGFAPRASARDWPGAELASRSLRDLVAQSVRDPREAAHLAAIALCGRTSDPGCEGSAAQLLAPGQGLGGAVLGGHARLGAALLDAARAFGAEFTYGLEASEIRRVARKGFAIMLADGSEIEARMVISTLDVKRTFLSLFRWNTLPRTLADSAAHFRIAGARARILFALARPPERAEQDSLRCAVHVGPDLEGFASAHAAWRAGTMPPAMQATLRLPSAIDPSLAPSGAAVMTVTLGAIPFRLFDGAWSHEKREALRMRALEMAESVWPGVGASVLAADVIVPGDIEDALGATEGDLDGGEIAADQMFDLRPWDTCPRTSVSGLYLAGRSAAVGPLGTGAAGAIAAECALADLKRRFLS